jgi:hypothetical protein
MSKTHLLAVLVLSVFAASARADLLYSFSYTSRHGPIESFEFSFTVPTFVTEGQSPAFTPFVVTDGTTRWTIDEDLVTTFCGSSCTSFPSTGENACFMFGTSTYTTLIPGCADRVSFGGLEIDFSALTPLPTAKGVYTYNATAHSTAPFDDSAGNGQLTISPEPSPVVLLLTVLLGVAFAARKRIAQTVS